MGPSSDEVRFYKSPVAGISGKYYEAEWLLRYQRFLLLEAWALALPMTGIIQLVLRTTVS